MYKYFRYKDNSPEVAETARALATAYSNVGEEDAESKCDESMQKKIMFIFIVEAVHFK